MHEHIILKYNQITNSYNSLWHCQRRIQNLWKGGGGARSQRRWANGAMPPGWKISLRGDSDTVFFFINWGGGGLHNGVGVPSAMTDHCGEKNPKNINKSKRPKKGPAPPPPIRHRLSVERHFFFLDKQCKQLRLSSANLDISNISYFRNNIFYSVTHVPQSE